MKTIKKTKKKFLPLMFEGGWKSYTYLGWYTWNGGQNSIDNSEIDTLNFV